MNEAAPHISLQDNGDVQLRLVPEDVKALTGHDLTKLLALQDRIKAQLFICQMEAACRSEAAA